MAIIYSYPTLAPQLGDKVLGSNIVDSAGQPVLGNPTVQYTLNDIKLLVDQNFVQQLYSSSALTITPPQDNTGASIKFGASNIGTNINNVYYVAATNTFTFNADIMLKYKGNLKIDCEKHIILGMMANKDHRKYISFFKDIASLTTIDIPNQPNSIKGKELKDKLNSFSNINYKESIQDAIKSIPAKEKDIILITGSLYLAGEVLNLN